MLLRLVWGQDGVPPVPSAGTDGLRRRGQDLAAQACNISFEPLVRTDQPALSRARLSWVSQNFIRPETIAAASARIVAA